LVGLKLRNKNEKSSGNSRFFAFSSYMNRILLLICAMFIPLLCEAQTVAPDKSEYISLDGASIPAGNPIENNPDVRVILHFKQPVLWIFRSKAETVQGTVLLCPGGAYCALDVGNEGGNTARILNDQGFDVAILEYHIASGANERDLALADALEAFRLLKSQGTSMGLHNSQVEIMGYSAGGHLAARTVQKLGENEQPDALILVYPAYLNETKPESSDPVVVPPAKPRRLLALFAVNDNPDWIKGCQTYVDAWKSSGGDVTFHLLSDGGHGFGMAAKSSDSNQDWPDLLKTFLLSQSDMEKPTVDLP
jgi:dienelactone hydrolase